MTTRNLKIFYVTHIISLREHCLSNKTLATSPHSEANWTVATFYPHKL